MDEQKPFTREQCGQFEVQFQAEIKAAEFLVEQANIKRQLFWKRQYELRDKQYLK